jgi:sporulation protein YlmC with PRC-barrel domain
MSTAIVGLAALPGFAIAQSDQADDTMTQEQTETDSQTGTGTGVEASEVEGAPVMSRDGDKLADVSEVLLTEDGSIEAIVVNVGGFLGIGSKPVEVPFDKVTLQTNDEDGEMSIIIPMTEQDLKDMPRYEEG